MGLLGGSVFRVQKSRINRYYCHSTGLEDMYYGTWVYAEARNDESKPLADVYGVVWSLYQNDYSSMSPQPIATCLAPGETVAFTRFLYGVGGTNLDTIKVAAQGVLSPCSP